MGFDWNMLLDPLPSELFYDWPDSDLWSLAFGARGGLVSCNPRKIVGIVAHGASVCCSQHVAVTNRCVNVSYA